MAEKGKRGSRVRGASVIRTRSDWPYSIPHFEWIERLNFVRASLGDDRVSELLGYSLTDPTFKSVRRLTTGERLPNGERYTTVNRKYNELQKKKALISVAEEINNLVVGELKPNYRTKINMFLQLIKQFRFRTSHGQDALTPGTPEAMERMEGKPYRRSCDVNAFNKAGGRQYVGLLMISKVDGRDETGDSVGTEVYLQQRLGFPSMDLIQNALDTWLEGLRDQNYIHFTVLGVWWSYV